MKKNLILFAFAAIAAAQTPTYTTVTVQVNTGQSPAKWNGALQISSPVAIGTPGASIGQWAQTYPIQNGATLTIGLAPNDTMTPAGYQYVFQFRPSNGNGAPWFQYCTVPTSATPVTYQTICTVPGQSPSVPPSFSVTAPLSYNATTAVESCPTCGVTGQPLSQFAATTSAQLRGVLSDETGTGAAVFQNGDLGTPTAGVGTNLTGLNASQLTSGTVPAARLPNPSATTLGGTESLAPVTHQFMTGISTGGVPSQAQPAAADVTGLAASATTDTTNAANITSGVLPNGRVPSPQPSLVGLLHWWQSTKTISTCGNTPEWVTFDGEFIWIPCAVQHATDGKITKISAAGTVIFTITTTGCQYPNASVFDGTYIWIACTDNGKVQKMNLDGSIVGTYSAGTQANGMAFDGTNLWVANQTDTGTITKINPTTGATIGTYANSSAQPIALAYDGNGHIFSANYTGGNISKINTSDGSLVGNYTCGTGCSPQAIAFDGTNIWVALSGYSHVAKYVAATGAYVTEYNVGVDPIGVVFDGTNIWVSNSTSGTVTELLASSGAVLQTVTVGSFPLGIGYDGQSVWVVNGGDNTVTKITPKATTR